MSSFGISLELETRLSSIYEEVMWLALRKNVSAGRARGWYTHIMADTVRLQIRRFSGQVSREAVSTTGTDLRLEHYKRIQTTLTALVEHHRSEGVHDAGEFIRTLLEYEKVHIVTARQNHDARKAEGDYAQAGIVLVPWAEIPQVRQAELWEKMLRGKVANAAEFVPK